MITVKYELFFCHKNILKITLDVIKVEIQEKRGAKRVIPSQLAWTINND